EQRVVHALHATGARARRMCGGEARGIDVAVALDPCRAHDAVELDQGEALLRFLGRDQVDVKAESLRHRRRALELAPAVGRRGKSQATDAVPTRRLPGLCFELRVE